MFKIIQRLQNNPLTRWIWVYWQHEDTGYICILPFWRKPNKRYFKISCKK